MKKNEEKMSILLLGESFPKMEVQTTHGKMSFPRDLKGKWTVLFSHPADFTPVCTTEFVAFNKRYNKFKKLNTQLVGLSIDQVFSHIKWIEWIKDNLDESIKFPVIADDRGLVAEQLGMVQSAKGTNTVRAVFIIDSKGIIRTILYYPQEVGRNVDEILRTVNALQVSDKNGVACPENYPNNELIGKNVIIPPASDEKTAKTRKKQKNCFDWWFCHKNLK